MEAENPEFQLACDESENLKNNLFILTCNEKGISRFESIIGIVPLESDTLESRISRVFTRWNERLPYTFKFLLSKLNSLCGANNYIINRDINKYTMEITTHLELSGQVDELDRLLDGIIPANIELKANNQIKIETSNDMNIASGLVYCDMFHLTDSFKEDFKITGDDKFAGVVVDTIQINVSDSYKDNVSISSDYNIGSIVNICESLKI